MPLQLKFFATQDTHTPALPICEGGCGHALAPNEGVEAPAGIRYCINCFTDLFILCPDCSVAMSLNEWGNCDTAFYGPDSVGRCQTCHDAKYITCQHCCRLHSRDTEGLREHPNDDGQFYCPECWLCNWFECADCGYIGSRHERHDGPDSTHYCLDCFSADYVTCSVCGGAIFHVEQFGPENDPCCETCVGCADTWKPQPWEKSVSTCTRVGSSRSFGIELETSECCDYKKLHGQTVWGCVYECSTPGREFVSPILQGDAGFEEIEDMCDFAEDHDWEVNSSCGLHIHLDARDLSSNELLRVAYAYRKSYMLWKKFVTRSRAENSMCGAPQYTLTDVKAAEHFEDLAELCDRFEYVNLRSYISHGSIEIRIYPGTLDAQEVCSWVAIHTQFIDAVKGMTFDELDACFGRTVASSWKGMCDIIGPPDLLKYWRNTAARRNNNLLDHWNDYTPSPTLSAGMVA